MSTDDNGINPQFQLGENFSSAFLGKASGAQADASNPANDAKLISNFIDLITNPDKRELRSEALNTIRKSKAQQFLVDLIASPAQEKHQKALVMACWECGLDFSSYLIFFSELVENCAYPVALEAITVIDEMHDLSDIPNCKKALEILESSSLSAEKQILTSETVVRLKSITG